MPPCPSCSKLVPRQARYCGYCGTRVGPWPIAAVRRLSFRWAGLWWAGTLLAWGLVWLLISAIPLPPSGPTLLWTAGAYSFAGLMVGAAQFGLLKQQGRDPRWWPVATAAGWLVGSLIAGGGPAIATFGGGLGAALLAGTGAGLLQLPLARHLTDRLASWVALTAGSFGLVYLVRALPSLGLNQVPAFRGVLFTAWSPQMVLGDDLFNAALLGLLLGAGQYRLLRFTPPGGIRWPLLTVVGSVVITLGLDLLFRLAYVGDPAAELADGLIPQLLPWASAGIAVSAGQWILLQRRMPPAEWWVPLTALGVSLGASIPLLLGLEQWLVPAAALGGLLSGAAGWSATRAELPRTGSLLWTQAAAWGLASAATPLVAPLVAAGWSWAAPALATLLLGLMPSLVLGQRR